MQNRDNTNITGIAVNYLYVCKWSTPPNTSTSLR